MHVISDPNELNEFAGCAFVPTMGSLHDGHLSLIRMAKLHGKQVLVSIFVNPEQFAPDEDFEKYPRNMEKDSALARDSGADIVFAPEIETIYPETPSDMSLPAAALEPQLEDAQRPSHFRGVCLVVAKLFDLVQPSIAVFGEKDYQQFLVVQQMVKNEGARWNKLELVLAPTVRDHDGLALSSRNVYLTTDERSQALAIHRALGEPNERAMLDVLDHHGLEVEYAAIRDEATLMKPRHGQSRRALIAAHVGNVRLIDNCRLERLK